jgi:hypothetical protein
MVPCYSFHNEERGMRVVTILVILAVVGAVGYVLVFKRDWLMQKKDEVLHRAEGYTPAKTPSEAMDQFTHAVKKRNYKAAALYCTRDYGEQLVKAHDAASSIGESVDKVLNLMEGKATDKTVVLLRMLDPFPPFFKVKDVKQKGDRAVGQFVPEASGVPPANVNASAGGLDPVMFRNVLQPYDQAMLQVEVVKEGSGDDAAWKLNVPLSPAQRNDIAHFIEHNRSYVQAMDRLLTEARNGRYLKNEFEREVVRAFAESK